MRQTSSPEVDPTYLKLRTPLELRKALDGLDVHRGSVQCSICPSTEKHRGIGAYVVWPDQSVTVWTKRNHHAEHTDDKKSAIPVTIGFTTHLPEWWCDSCQRRGRSRGFRKCDDLEKFVRDARKRAARKSGLPIRA